MTLDAHSGVVHHNMGYPDSPTDLLGYLCKLGVAGYVEHQGVHLRACLCNS